MAKKRKKRYNNKQSPDTSSISPTEIPAELLQVAGIVVSPEEQEQAQRLIQEEHEAKQQEEIEAKKEVWRQRKAILLKVLDAIFPFETFADKPDSPSEVQKGRRLIHKLIWCSALVFWIFPPPGCEDNSQSSKADQKSESNQPSSKKINLYPENSGAINLRKKIITRIFQHMTSGSILRSSVNHREEEETMLPNSERQHLSPALSHYKKAIESSYALSVVLQGIENIPEIMTYQDLDWRELSKGTLTEIAYIRGLFSDQSKRLLTLYTQQEGLTAYNNREHLQREAQKAIAVMQRSTNWSKCADQPNKTLDEVEFPDPHSIHDTALYARVTVHTGVYIGVDYQIRYTNNSGGNPTSLEIATSRLPKEIVKKIQDASDLKGPRTISFLTPEFQDIEALAEHILIRIAAHGVMSLQNTVQRRKNLSTDIDTVYKLYQRDMAYKLKSQPQ